MDHFISIVSISKTTVAKPILSAEQVSKKTDSALYGLEARLVQFFAILCHILKGNCHHFGSSWEVNMLLIFILFDVPEYVVVNLN
jgi:hypothetical protein